MDRRKLIVAGLAVVPVWWGLRQVASGAPTDRHSETGPLEQAFPVLGTLTDAAWVSSRDNDRGTPSPELALSGFARLAAGRLDELTAAHAFVAAETVEEFTGWFEKPLKGRGPKNPQWIRSEELDRAGSGVSVKLWFDRGSETVRFRALNPYG
ncbi:hypothetical protein [Kitasatospora cheerisanensis]|uniref:Uncharacterized protein n=1 Tax=Kitasatospora cheerisanensis KCTC 2395 TaxID=1348663 RepID=A0A066Z349_9ACTN|nr:hypothetical protein [Kitasatospora cheerisanensis]KDN88168.1 hypothetical protein KCH_01000 [Kitasatospora cheerisanensis KCTC 2395]